MLHVDLNDPRLWSLLLWIDLDLAQQVQASGCPCGGRLHRGDYVRKPRGIARSLLRDPRLMLDRRISLCCAADGCRRRSTPPSVRFLGRRVYLDAVVVLASALAQGLPRRRRRELEARFGVGSRTLDRWRDWWQRTFTHSGVWMELRAQFATLGWVTDLPAALLRALLEVHGDLRRALLALLSALLPLTTGSTQSSRYAMFPQKMPVPLG